MSNVVPLVVRAARSLAPSTLELRLEARDGSALPFTPGQFVSLHFEHQGEIARRSYSIATRTDTPEDNHIIDIAIAYVEGGKASEFFFKAEAGAELGMTGPFGLLVLPEEMPKRMVLVATGTGVAPYRSMLPRIRRELLAAPEKSVWLLFGCRRPAEALYADEFLALAAELPNFHYRVSVSREAPQQGHERKGHVQHQLAELAPNPNEDLFFLCGNPAMVDDVFSALKEQGFGVKNVRREKYVFSAK